MSNKDVVYLSNLPHDVSSETIIDWFQEEGPITVKSVEMLKKGGGGGRRVRTCGLAVVYLSSAEDVEAALKLDGKEVMGRPMIVRLNKFVEDQACYKPPKVAPPPAMKAIGGMA